MTVFRVKLDFNKSILGASETYWTPDWTATVAAGKIKSMLEKRFALLAPDTYMVGVRISIDGQRRRSSFIKPPSGYILDSGVKVQIPKAGTFPMNGLAVLRESPFRLTLNMKTGFDGTRRTTRYLSCIPQGIVRTEPATLPDTLPEPFATALSQFQDEIINVWQIRARVAGPGNPPSIPAEVKYRVVGIVQGVQTPPLLGINIQVPGPTALAWTQGQRIQAMSFRPPKGTRLPTLNGTWYVDSVLTFTNGATVYLRGSDKVVPSQVNFTDVTFLRQVDYSYYPVQIFTPDSIGIHKRGRPSAAPRGRRLTRPTLDP